MKRILLAAAALALLVSNASAEFRAADIAKLPQEKVAVIKQDCAKKWGDNFRMREFCEDQQYESLQNLIARGSIKPNGEKL